jgi:hypothetical protein
MQSYQKAEILARIKQKDLSLLPIYECLKGLTIIHLSKCGQCRLMAFPEEQIKLAISDLENRIQKGINISSRYKYLFATSLRRCEQLGIRPDWKWSYDLLDALGIPKDRPEEIDNNYPKVVVKKKDGESTPEYHKPYKPNPQEKHKDICDEARKVMALRQTGEGRAFLQLVGREVGYNIITQLEELCREYGVDPQNVYQGSITEEDIRNTNTNTAIKHKN